jgi:phosphoribosyl 1,2-cyclic phosphodiesterase
MKILPVGSSSSGNSTLVFNDNTHILIDCGISAKKILAKTGRNTFDALFLSHEHGDHVSGAGPVGRKTKVPIYLHEVVYKDEQEKLENCVVHFINEMSEIKIGDFTIKPFSTKHDAKYSLGFVVEEKGTGINLCYLTDTGSISKTMRERTKHCNAFFIECDYDDDMILTYDGYDQLLKDRIMSNFGHLSTAQAIEFIEGFDLDKIKAVIIGHISTRTNSPQKVLEHVQEKLAAHKNKFFIAPFEQPLVLA